MTELYITKATPNPAGKDHLAGRPPTNDQLNGEWLEFKNITQQAVSLDGVKLSHYTFNDVCKKTGEMGLVTFKGDGGLAAGKSLRVHSGSGTGWWEGHVYHYYADHGNFVWNNKCGDTAVLRDSAGHVTDWATYAPNPGEGAVLLRVPNTNILK